MLPLPRTNSQWAVDQNRAIDDGGLVEPNTTSQQAEAHRHEGQSGAVAKHYDMDLFRTVLFPSPLTPNERYQLFKGSHGAPDGHNSYKLSFSLYTGKGEPNPDVGDPSDVYFDLDANRIYAKLEESQWNYWDMTKLDMADAKYPVIQYPFHSKLVLWSKPKLGVQWFCRDNIKTQRARRKGEVVTVEDAIRLTIDYCRGDEDKKTTSKGKGKQKVTPEPIISHSHDSSLFGGPSATPFPLGQLPSLHPPPSVYTDSTKLLPPFPSQPHPFSFQSGGMVNLPHFSVPFNPVVEPQLPTSLNALDLPSQGMEDIEMTDVSPDIDLESAPLEHQAMGDISIPRFTPAGSQKASTPSPPPGAYPPGSPLTPLRTPSPPIIPWIDTSSDNQSSRSSQGPPTIKLPAFNPQKRSAEDSIVSSTVKYVYQVARSLPEAFLNSVKFPKAKLVTWANGMKTILPGGVKWGRNADTDAVNHMASAPDLTDPNNPISYPGDPRVDAHIKNPIVVVLHWDQPLLGGLKFNPIAAVLGHQPAFKAKVGKAYNDFIGDLRHHLACGRYVIIRGWYPQHKVIWDHRSVENFKGSLDQQVEYQDHMTRAATYNLSDPHSEGFHKSCTLGDFLHMVNDEDVIGNVLESPSVRAETPQYMLDVSDETRGLELTRLINTVQLPLCADFAARQQVGPWIKSGGAAPGLDKCLCSAIENMLIQQEKQREKAINTDLAHRKSHRVPAKLRNKRERESANVAKSRHMAEPQPLSYPTDQTFVPVGMSLEEEDPTADHHIMQEFPDLGPFAWTWDGLKSLNWDLITHPGFLTWGHQDAAGFLTYGFCRTGCKIWCILKPKMEGIKTRDEYFEVLSTILQQHPILDYQSVSDPYTIFLMEGDVLIQPPHATHMVFTPVPSIASGGHCTPLETLHLTEIARHLDRFYSNRSTNAEHPAIHRSLCRLAMSLPVICETRVLYRRPILALASMILDRARYEPDRFDMSNLAHLNRFDILRLETEADHRYAAGVMMMVLDHLGLTVKDAQTELEAVHEQLGDRWADATGETVDLSFLKNAFA